MTDPKKGIGNGIGEIKKGQQNVAVDRELSGSEAHEIFEKNPNLTSITGPDNVWIKKGTACGPTGSFFDLETNDPE